MKRTHFLTLPTIVTLVVALAGTGTLAVIVYPPIGGVLFGLGPAILGRTAPCGRIEAIRGLLKHVRASSGASQVAAASRLLARDPAGYDQWETPAGRFWIPAGSDAVLPVLLSQQYEQIYGPIRSGDVVLDCGAHIGVYTREALRAGARLVVAIEPAPDNLECLQRNFEPEIRDGRVIVYPKGVWDKEDVLVLHTVAGNSAGDSFVVQYGPGKEVTVPLTTIDRIVTELNLPRVDLIKMDIKGAERQALRGGTETIRSQKPRLAIASEHLPDDPEQIQQLFRRVRPDYRSRCESCFYDHGRIRPEVLVFR